MKRFVRCTSFVLVIALLFAIPVFAAETGDTKASSFFISSSVYLCNVSGNSFEAWFDVTATGIMDEIGANYIKIQRSSDGKNWTTVKTCAKANYLALINYDTVGHTSGVYHEATGGYYYRACIQLYAKKGVNTGTMNEYTSAIYIPAN